MKIKTIEIEMSDEGTIKLTLEEAESLFNQLNKIFGRKIKYVQTQPATTAPIPKEWCDWNNPYKILYCAQ